MTNHTIFTKTFLLFVLIFVSSSFFGQMPTQSFKIKKSNLVDSAFFDLYEYAIYSKTSGYENRFKTLKQCSLAYSIGRKEGLIVLKSNRLPKSLQKKIDKTTKRVELKFTDIILLADSLNPDERTCPQFISTIRTKRVWWFYFGPTGKIPSPIPTDKYQVSKTTYPKDNL